MIMATANGLHATEKQLTAISRLRASKQLDDAGRAWLDTKVGPQMPRALASLTIQRLIALSNVTQSSTIQITDGMYLRDGLIYKVQMNRAKTRLYAKLLVPGEFGEATWDHDAAKGMVYRLTEADKMSKEQAIEFGQLYGVCVICGATLTLEESIERAMGPVCAAKNSWA